MKNNDEILAKCDLSIDSLEMEEMEERNNFLPINCFGTFGCFIGTCCGTYGCCG